VTSRTAALRYARALFDVAVKENQPSGASAQAAALQVIDEQLAFFVDLLEQHPVLAKVLLNPAVPAPRKRAAVAELVRQAELTGSVAKLLALLAERDRLVLLPEILAEYRQRVLDHHKIVRVVVTTPTSISADRAGAIERSLVQATGRTVVLVARVDPTLIGGIVTRIGSTVYDGSLAGQLERMRARLERGQAQ
jgi:F-type H+-transporting ATPase subunit delta